MTKEQKFQLGEDGTYNESRKQRYYEWKSKGLCVICGDAPAATNNTRCAKHKTTKEQYRRNLLKTCYGITLEQYNSLLILQDGNCAICKEHMNDPHVDHDHNTNKLRGLLCKKCNTALGMVNDDIKRLETMIQYLKGFQN